MHDAWTCWEHSGAPLLKEIDGTLVGLHSSWDGQTTMRHGVPLVAIQQFLEQHLPSALDPDQSISAAATEGNQATEESYANVAPRAGRSQEGPNQESTKRTLDCRDR